MVEVLSFPVFPYKSSSFKVTTHILMFFFPLNLNFNSRPCITPFFHSLFQFFLSSFFSYFSILVLKPSLFNLLFHHIICWVVVQIIWFAFKSVLCFEHYWLSCTVELIKRMWVDWPLLFFKVWLQLSTHFSYSLWCYTTEWSIF